MKMKTGLLILVASCGTGTAQTIETMPMDILNSPVLLAENTIDRETIVRRAEPVEQVQSRQAREVPTTPTKVSAKRVAIPKVSQRVTGEIYSLEAELEPQPQKKSAPMNMSLEISELVELKRAARKAGGDVEISIKPVGVSVEEMYLPLKESGKFDVSLDGDTIVVRSVETAAELHSDQRNRLRKLIRQVEILSDQVEAPETQLSR